MGVAAAVVRRAVPPAGERGGAIVGLVLDLTRSRKELLAENAFLRHQLVIPVPQGEAADAVRWRLARASPRRCCDGIALVWARCSKPKSLPKPRLPSKLIALIKRMAMENRTWGAKWIHGELLKLGIEVAKSAIQLQQQVGRAAT
jgi:hypothetical protein